MRTVSGVQGRSDESARERVAGGRVLLGCLLAVIASAGVVGGKVDVSRANPLKRVSYSASGDFVVLSLKKSSTTAARVPQETLSSGYDVVSKSVEMAVALPSLVRVPARDGSMKALASQAACEAGGMIDTCPVVMTLLDSAQGDRERLPIAALRSADVPEIVLAPVGEKLPVLTDDITASIDRLAAPKIERMPVSGKLVDAIVAQADCETGGMFDECPGFLRLLQSRQQAWPRIEDAALPARDELLMTASVSKTLIASAGERVSLAAGVVESVDWSSMKAGEVIVGVASTYNPYDINDRDAGGAQTASGELYNPIAWTAAIQIKLRKEFSGVRYGRLYTPRFALVERDGMRAIVKINDVGPLRPGRVIDFSTQVMHYFDPSLRLGLLDGVTVTPLSGSDWTPGPLGTAPAIAVASSAP